MNCTAPERQPCSAGPQCHANREGRVKKKHGCEMYFNDVGVREQWGVLDKWTSGQEAEIRRRSFKPFCNRRNPVLDVTAPKSCIWCWPFTVYADALILDSLQKHFGQKVACVSLGSRYSQVPLSCSIVMFKAALFAVFFPPSMAPAGWPLNTVKLIPSVFHTAARISSMATRHYSFLSFGSYCILYCIIDVVILLFAISNQY